MAHSTYYGSPWLCSLCLLWLQRVFEMYDAAKLGAVGEEQLRCLLAEMGLNPAEDVGEACRVEELFDQLRATGRCVAPDGALPLTLNLNLNLHPNPNPNQARCASSAPTSSS